MRPNLLILATLLGLTTACGRETSPDRTEQVGPSAPRTEAPTAPDVLRIDPSMLPDLRMTTAAVEERSASTEVDMLGEIGVNRDTYAEVAPPIDAQVVRLLVGVNSVFNENLVLDIFEFVSFFHAEIFDIIKQLQHFVVRTFRGVRFFGFRFRMIQETERTEERRG